MTDRFRELVPLAALDALDGEDAREFREHAAGCAECQAELDAYLQVAGAIGASVPPVPPPPALRARVLASVGPAAPARRRLGWLAPLGAAAAVALGIGLVVSRQQLSRERGERAALEQELLRAREELSLRERQLAESAPVRDLLAQPDSRLTTLAGLPAAPRARARVLWNPSTRQAVLLAAGLEPAPAGQAYEVWVIGQGAPVPAGVFQTAPDGTAVFALPPVDETARVRTFAVTLEPAAGSPAPTGPMVLAGAVS